MAIDTLAIGDDEFEFHDFGAVGRALEDALRDIADVELTTERDAVLTLDDYDVFVDYTTKAEWTPAQLDAIQSFVTAGSGYVRLHCATVLDSFVDEPCPELADLIGGRFLTHPEMTTIDIEIGDAAHPVTDGVDGFQIYDEPYELDWDADRVTVLAEFTLPETGTMPAAWVRTEGDGRVFYCSLGHDSTAFENAGFRRLLRNGLQWVVEGHS
ncbi:ThuA domain-containing protein [Haloarcula sp. GH36]|uniref:ThuA domain-containing protein n=1 Tax=Haloarcula montana TaxID=3111776 RepID=UPI002D7721B1|nr:ThuA domain-containing protein [Haloarcula sp. GH36]